MIDGTKDARTTSKNEFIVTPARISNAASLNYFAINSTKAPQPSRAAAIPILDTEFRLCVDER
jgi:hypothetical protein